MVSAISAKKVLNAFYYLTPNQHAKHLSFFLNIQTILNYALAVTTLESKHVLITSAQSAAKTALSQSKQSRNTSIARQNNTNAKARTSSITTQI